MNTVIQELETAQSYLKQAVDMARGPTDYIARMTCVENALTTVGRAIKAHDEEQQTLTQMNTVIGQVALAAYELGAVISKGPVGEKKHCPWCQELGGEHKEAGDSEGHTL